VQVATECATPVAVAEHDDRMSAPRDVVVGLNGLLIAA
jgi:hypothetical protein